MFNRGFFAAACGALALSLAAAGSCPAQFVFFPVGRASPSVIPIGPRSFGFFPTSYGYGPSYYTPSYGAYGAGYNPYGPTGYSSYSYSMDTTTPLYYGAASFAPGYSAAGLAYSAPRLVSPSPDVAQRAAGKATEAAYSASSYPIHSPDFSTVYPVSPPLSMLAETKHAEGRARVEVCVPACAEVCFNGHVMNQGGTARAYTSPALEAGQDYVYEVHARWDDGGQPVDMTRKVTVHAGDHVVVDFLQPVTTR